MNRNELINEHLQLVCWFDREYRRKAEKYYRLSILEILDDDGQDPKVKQLELFKIAETKRKRIQELEKLLNITEI